MLIMILQELGLVWLHIETPCRLLIGDMIIFGSMQKFEGPIAVNEACSHLTSPSNTITMIVRQRFRVLAGLSAFALFALANASTGDRLPEFRNCVEVFQNLIIAWSDNEADRSNLGLQAGELCQWAEIHCYSYAYPSDLLESEVANQ